VSLLDQKGTTGSKTRATLLHPFKGRGKGETISENYRNLLAESRDNKHQYGPLLNIPNLEGEMRDSR